jgi:hypothetical protein
MRRVSDEVFEKLMKAVRCQDFLEVLNIFNEELNKGIQGEICLQCPQCTPAVEEVIENFDFEKVHEVMRWFDWKWDGDNPGELPTTPTVEKMKEVVKDLFRGMEDQIAKGVAKSGTWPDCTSTGTAGGFRATIDDDVYTLEFVLEEYETDLESQSNMDLN